MAAETQPPEPTEGSENESGLAPFLLVEDPPVPTGLRRLAVNRTLGWHVFKVALPVVIGMVTQALINILDGVMVGYLPKEEANPGQAAIGLALPFMWLVGGGLSAVWVGTQAITSRRAGEGNDDLAGRALTNSLVIAVSSSATLSALAIFVTPYLIRALYQDPVVVQYGIDYIQIRMVGILAMVGTFSFKSFFDGIGKTHIFMTAAVTMNLTNVLLNFLLIYGYEPLGIERLGVRGAALASVISAFLGWVILIGWSFAPKYLKRYQYYDPRKLNGRVISEIIRLSVPNAIATIIVMIGFSAFYFVVGQVSDLHAVEGNPVVATANQVVIMATMPGFMTALGFGTATAAVVGQALGAKRPYLAERYGWEAVKLWSYVMGVIGVLVTIFPEVLAGLLNPDPEVIAAATTPLRMTGLMSALVPIAMILAQTLYGVGMARYVMTIELVLHVFVMSPAAALFGLYFDLGLVGVWLGPMIYAGLLAASVLWKFSRGDWKDVEV